MAFDYKKEFKELYRPSGKPTIVTVPPMRYIAVRGKGDFNFISCIRVPDFVTEAEFRWAVEEATAKKKADFSKVELMAVDEGLCVQCMHTGAYDDEPATADAMHVFASEQGYQPDFSATRLHHEIYLSDPRKCAPEKLKTVVRHPIAK